nr:PREDICTED: protein Lilipod [Bemisia tabaci]
MESEADLREQIFHNTVREYIIFLLLYLLLYVCSFAVIGRFRRRDRDDYFSCDEDEAVVYKISLALCTFSLSVAICAALLLPFSIASNEVLLLYPNSYYVKWLNHSLIQGLWNVVFLSSNLSLFIFLPFAYLFTESEGFAGQRKGVWSRVYETFTVLLLLGVVVLGFMYVISAWIDGSNSSFQTLLNLWSYYLPFLYSCISFVGVLMLLLSTPLGFVRLFSLVGRVLIKPQFLSDLDEKYEVAKMNEETVQRQLIQATKTGKTYLSVPPMFSATNSDNVLHLQNGALQAGLLEKLEVAQKTRAVLEMKKQTAFWQRNLLYPIAMVSLLALTVMTVLLVIQNTLELLIGIKALPLSTRQFTLGISSLSKLGLIGATVEIILIFFLILTSFVGLYSLPILTKVRPKNKETPLTHIISNCALLVILSSALPLLSRILGITNFDLLGDFGQIEWLGNFKIVFLYNIVFAAAATLCLVNKFTAPVRRETYLRLIDILSLLFNESQINPKTSASSKEKSSQKCLS